MVICLPWPFAQEKMQQEKKRRRRERERERERERGKMQLIKQFSVMQLIRIISCNKREQLHTGNNPTEEKTMHDAARSFSETIVSQLLYPFVFSSLSLSLSLSLSFSPALPRLSPCPSALLSSPPPPPHCFAPFAYKGNTTTLTPVPRRLFSLFLSLSTVLNHTYNKFTHRWSKWCTLR